MKTDRGLSKMTDIFNTIFKYIFLKEKFFVF